MRQGQVFKRCTKCGGNTDLGRGSAKHARCDGTRWTWAYVVDTAPPGGPRKQRAKAGFKTKSAALEAMKRLEVGVADRRHVETSRLTVGRYLQTWLEGVQVKPSTKDSYELHVRRRITPHIGDVRLQDLEPQDVRALYGKLRASGGKDGRPLSAKTVHNVHLCLRVALAQAVRDRLILTNPADAAHRLPDSPEMKYWTPAQLKAFLAHVANDRLFALWRVAAATGLRRGELLGLQWNDLDMEAGILTVRRQWAKASGSVALTTLKGRQGKPKTRRVDLGAATLAALRRHSVQQLEERAFLGLGRRPADARMFVREDGTPIDPDGLTSRFERHVRAAGLPPIRLHDMRHSSATAALAAGVHPKIVQERLGHASVTTTMNTYSHAIPTLQAEAAEKIERAIDF